MLNYIAYNLIKEHLERIHVFINPLRRALGILPKPHIQFGTIGEWYFPYPFIFSGKYVKNHKWILGKIRTGKSKLIADMAGQLILQGQSVGIIDPHSDLATEVLIILTQNGYFKREDAQKKFWYIDFGVQDKYRTPTHFVPFNILNQSVDKYVVARGVVEAMKRVWPYLRTNAPHFENVLLNSLLVLIDNKLPITAIDNLLTDQEYREKLLENVTDTRVINFFHFRYDQWRFEQALMRESTLNKTSLFTMTPVLRYSLGAKDNLLDFRRIIDEGITVVFNVRGLDDETQQLIGALLAVGFEQAAMSRDTILDRSRRRDYYLFIDEFDKFSAQSEVTLSDILAKCLKFRLYLTLANQTISQTTERLLGALQNTQTITFRLGADDALKMANWYCDHDPYQMKHEIEDPTERPKKHPQFVSAQDTHELWKVALKTLRARRFYTIFDKQIWRVQTTTLPPITVGWEKIAEIKKTFTDQLMVRREQAIDTPSLPENTTVVSGREKPVALS